MLTRVVKTMHRGVIPIPVKGAVTFREEGFVTAVENMEDQGGTGKVLFLDLVEITTVVLLFMYSFLFLLHEIMEYKYNQKAMYYMYSVCS